MFGTRSLRGGVVALAAVAALGLPERGQAQSINMTATMGATCMGMCDVVKFTLALSPADAYIDLARLFSSAPGTWQFGGLLAVQDKNTVDTGWQGTLANGGLLLRGAGVFAAEPVYIYVAMSTWGTESELYNGSLTFTGQGNTQIDGLGQDISYGGTVGASTVTPEPASMLLLGTGLAGVVGAARRRRRKDVV